MVELKMTPVYGKLGERTKKSIPHSSATATGPEN